MPRVIWKGAISFGLVHVPVALYAASTDVGVDFDWLDSRTMDPVGYKRVNKRTGKEIDKAHIAKGIKLDSGEYVVLSEDDISAAYPQATQTIEIEGFVQATDISFVHLEKPYYLEPLAKGEKVYALLREAMLSEGVIGVARVVMHSKEHLAALIPSGPALVLNTLRWANEIRPLDELKLPDAGRNAAQLKPAMASQLVADMTVTWNPAAYADRFTDAVHALVAQRVAEGDTQSVTPVEPNAPVASTSNVVDLTALLKQSLGGRRAGPSGKGPSNAAPSGEERSRSPAPAPRAAASKSARQARASVSTKASAGTKSASAKTPRKRA